MLFLLSNDDGVHAPGLHKMREALSKIGKVVTVAPLEEKSTSGHSLTIQHPVRLVKLERDVYGVSGSPADCICVALREVMKGKKPDWVISGINLGANLGQDVFYSGTVSAAREASISGIPSIAVSLRVNFKKDFNENKLNFKSAARVTTQLIKQLDGQNVPHSTLLNINAPDVPYTKLKGVRLATQGFQYYDARVVKRVDHRGKSYFWVGGEYLGHRDDPGTDVYYMGKGYATVSPLTLDTTDHQYLENLAHQFPKYSDRRRPKK